MADFALDRFVEAQERVYPLALGELRRGRKESHWMWFVFPQIAGLGRSPTAQHFAIASIGEARAYLAHAVLGARLRESTAAVLAHKGRPPEEIFGAIDAIKFRSSMTLFEAAADGEGAFGEALDAFYGGERDPATLRQIGAG